MIRWVADKTNNGRVIIGLGITADNLRELQKGRPIFVAGESVRLPRVDIVIYYGESEYELTEQMASVIGPQTEIRRLTPEELPPGHPQRQPRDA